jgi:rubrerythrin
MYAENRVKRMARFQSRGIRHVRVISDEEELSKAYFDFAYFRSKNAEKMYENAAAVLPLPEQKALFLQLACRKRDVLTTLKMDRPDTVVTYNSARQSGLGSMVKYLMDTELSPHTTLKESFDFAYDKETKTLALYEKMAGVANVRSTRVLFDFLIESQRRHIQYLDSQLAISNGDLNRPVPEMMLELAYA